MSSWSKVCLPRVSSEHCTYFKILIDSQYDSGLSEATQASGAPQLQQATTPDLVKKTHIGTHYTRAETQLSRWPGSNQPCMPLSGLCRRHTCYTRTLTSPDPQWHLHQPSATDHRSVTRDRLGFPTCAEPPRKPPISVTFERRTYSSVQKSPAGSHCLAHGGLEAVATKSGRHRRA